MTVNNDTAETRETSDPYLAILAAEDSNPLIAELRRTDPVYHTSLGFWFITRHDDVRRLFNDPENATGDRRNWEHHVPEPEGTILHWSEQNNLFAMAPEDHARVRRLVSVAFTPRAVRRMDGQIREVIDRVAAPLLGRSGEVLDLLGDFTNIVPNTVISRLTGIPPAGDDEARFRQLAQSVIAGFLPFTPPDLKQLANDSFVELSGWVREMCVKRRAHPEEDLVSDLLLAQDADERLTEDDVVMLISGIVAAGSETTALGGMAMIATLLDHPEPLARLRADRSLMPQAVNEIIRFAFGGPAGLPRYAVRDFELRGKQIKKGQMLMLSFGGANRDPAIYENPDEIDFDRDNRELITFGHGPHFCLGANLARQEMGSMLDALLDIVTPGSAIVQEEMKFQDAGMFKRPLNLPVAIA
jgi:cytochrome P450 enzyme